MFVRHGVGDPSRDELLGDSACRVLRQPNALLTDPAEHTSSQ